MPTKAHDVYHVQMTEAKLRILAAERVSTASAPLTGLSSLDCEFCFLQIRKVIELITFGAMVREEHRYRHFRTTEPKTSKAPEPDPTRDWNAKEILSRLVKLSPHMLPIPLGAHSSTGTGTINFDRAKTVVNHSKLIELYGVCSTFMHASNPLGENYIARVEIQRGEYRKGPQTIKKALDFLRRLLWLHAAVQLEWSDQQNASCVDNPTSAWIVDFSSSENDVVNIVLATTQDTDPL
ncbi:hypothetical protein JAB5_27130 [Janthinobacterium sp. HH103]|uniref:hypothetical protein n=1 Tax=unclassified Janthinobacterium TaxID=2610881 RepID=UPI0008738415|nr:MULTISPECIES: hypothetical protein [unclassified Janthinobacterium]OEZ69272.1 hypothetical protein JAB2_14580 [Janthinobacterium sp. HH100]OEZ76404.1 hypothetical protein JAB5_27130 [Janthinobacterium sp. HH103]QOU76229.1 hypothetical protein JAB4_057290 [Janthinobacterium sp. HH102]